MSSQPPGINRILEASLYVEDLDRSARFYSQMFGLEPMLQDDRMCAMSVPGRQVLLLFRRGGSTVASETPFGFIPPHDGRGTQHICFSIDRQDLEAWQRRIEAMGVAIESRLDWSKGGSSLYFRDPDGHSLEVATPGLWPNDPIPGSPA
jgi:catechol 2,3-dioxygenase-like lactoylglutathione lyase family enzyme